MLNKEKVSQRQFRKRFKHHNEFNKQLSEEKKTENICERSRRRKNESLISVACVHTR